jgi:hypothetical protein
MKALYRHLSIILFLGFSFLLFSQYVPPGTVRLKPSETGIKHATFIDQTEITIQYWRDFLHWISIKYGTESAEYNAMLPYSAIGLWQNSSDWQHPQYRNYPMVCISYEQAIAYCKWRSDRINEGLSLNKKKKYNYTVSYSLPTETDFMGAYKQQKIKTDNKTLDFVRQSKKNEIKGIADNAQEFAVEKTVVTGENTGTLLFQSYQEANAMIGFRCVAEITNNKISK